MENSENINQHGPYVTWTHKFFLLQRMRYALQNLKEKKI